MAMDARFTTCARVAAASALLLIAGVAGAENFRIGGTGAALGTMRVLGEEFRKTRPGLEVEVLPSLGSPGGIRAAVAGAIDIGVSARPLKPEELAAGAELTPVGITPFVFAVAAPSKVTGLSSAELVEIYAGKKTRWPDGAPLRLVLRSPSGAEIALIYSISPQMKEAHMLAEKRPGLLTTATDQENADALETIPGAIGVISLAQLVSEKRSLHALQIDGVAPTPAALRKGSYRLWVPLYFATGTRSSPRAREFIAFTRSAAGAALLSRNGYLVSAPDETR
jgi:phosphate transport system substrate-binding protein